MTAMAKIHLIGNAHLDPAWLWRWQEGYSEVLATFRSALDRMNEFDDYIFTCAGAAYYNWVEETDPKMFEEIKQRVREGRWVIVGGYWIQPDCNAPSGESFARHALYSQRYFLSRFGVKAVTGYNVDSFGHNAMLPQLLKNSGMNAYVFMRPGPGSEKQYPFDGNSFIWESPDGTRIPTYRIPLEYTTGASAEKAVTKANTLLASSNESGKPEMCFYGVGNHGGGPTIETLSALKPLIETGDFTHSSPDKFFKALDKSALPIYKGDLQHHASGCYTSVMDIKQLNRIAEEKLIACEKYALLAGKLVHNIDTRALEGAWKTVLFNQFHDIMGGCCIFDAMQDGIRGMQSAIHTAEEITNRALQLIAWNIDTSKGITPVRDKNQIILWNREKLGTPVTFFNPSLYPVKVPLKVGADCEYIEDSAGKRMPSQRVRAQKTDGIKKYERAFVAELPALGWSTYWLHTDATETPAVSGGMLRASACGLENDFIKVSFCPATGNITEFTDKASGKNMLKNYCHDLVVDETQSDTWAHKIFEFRDVVGSFAGTEVTLAECGDVCATVKTTAVFGSSTITRYFTVYRELPGLYIRCHVNWNEKHRMLKLGFPTVFEKETEVASIPYGCLKRSANGKEQPMQNWVSIGSLGIVTDTRAAYDAFGGEIRVTALRSPLYADHYGDRDGFMEYTSQGDHRFNMVLMPSCEPALMTKLAQTLVCPPDRILGTYHKGTLGCGYSGIGTSGDNVLPSVLKPAEDGNGSILRVREPDGKAAHAHIRLAVEGTELDLQFKPFEIKTCRITKTGAEETDFIET